MRTLKIMNSKEKESFLDEACGKYGLNRDQFRELVFLEDDETVWVSNRDCLMHELRGFRLDSVGMFFARKKPKLELAVNAVQMFAAEAAKQIKLGRGKALEFIAGAAVAVKESDGVYVVKYGGDALDSGRVQGGLLKRTSKNSLI